MKIIDSSSRVTARQVTFYLSFLVDATGSPGPLPVSVGIGPGGSLWAAATDLSIEAPIMRRILKHPGPTHFYCAHRLFVNLHVVARIHPRGSLARRVRQVIGNCLSCPHPINFSN